jgi:hypothetical protein
MMLSACEYIAEWMSRGYGGYSGRRRTMRFSMYVFHGRR